MEERTQGWEPFGKNKDAWYYLNLPTFPTVRGTVEYKKPVSIDEFLKDRDSTPKELVDLHSQFLEQEGLRKTISVPFEGGKFVAKPNTSVFRKSDEPEISYYYDNSEYAKAAGQDVKDLESLESIFTTVAGVASSTLSKSKASNIILKAGDVKATIPITKGGQTFAQQRSTRKERSRLLRLDDSNTATDITPGGAIVKTSKKPKALESIVTGAVTKDDPVALGRQEFTTGSIPGLDGKDYAFLSDLEGKVDGSGGFLKRLGNKIVGNKQAQGNIFTNPNTGRAYRNMAPWKEAMNNEVEAFALSMLAKGNTGYKSLGEFRSKIISRLDDKNIFRLYQTLAEGNNFQNGYIEHLIQKSDAMNWYWNMKGEDRHGLQNVRIAFDTRLKVLKDITEGIVHGRKTSSGFKKGLGWQTDTLENRIIVSFEDPDVHSFVFNKTGLGNIVLRRAGNGKLVGKLGQYLSSLYPQNQGIAAQLESDIKDYIRSNKITITVKNMKGEDKVRAPTVAEWKRKFLENRINIIIKDSHKLSGMSESERNTFIGDVINEDMIQLRQEFPFLPQEQFNPLGEVGTDIPLSETGYLKRGQDKNPIPPLGDPRFKVKGPFPPKTEEMNQSDRPPGTPKSG